MTFQTFIEMKIFKIAILIFCTRVTMGEEEIEALFPTKTNVYELPERYEDYKKEEMNTEERGGKIKEALARQWR